MKFKHAYFLGLLFICFNAHAETSESTVNLTAPTTNPKDSVVQRTTNEDIVEANPFGITFYKQNYFIPYYYTGSPYNQVYKGQIPPKTKIKRAEIKYQLSLKVPVWKKFFGSHSSLYVGYTQLSYWQAYNTSAFFRETDFEPEVFLVNQLCIPLLGNWTISEVNIGANHQSNGYGNTLERSWNRAYLETVASSEHWMVSVKPWYVFHDSTYEKYNPNLSNYLGYGKITVAYKHHRQVFTLETHGVFEQGGKHFTALVSYSFPITTHINAFLQVFSGYGQSLIEYDHRTNSAGLGIALSNLI